MHAVGIVIRTFNVKPQSASLTTLLLIHVWGSHVLLPYLTQTSVLSVSQLNNDPVVPPQVTQNEAGTRKAEDDEDNYREVIRYRKRREKCNDIT